MKYDYLLVYAYDGRINKKDEISAIQQLPKRNAKSIKCWSLSVMVRYKYKRGSLELLGYVKNAKYIVIDTFHGTVFSIKYNKPFATIIRGSNRQKISDLLVDLV